MSFKPVLIRTVAAVGALATTVASLPADARQNMFLEIEGIKGESTSEQGKDMIEIRSFSHGVSMPLTQGPSNTSRASGRCVHQNFTITKHVDIATPTLNLKASAGQDIKAVKLHVWKSDSAGKPMKYLQYSLESVIVTSVTVSGEAETPVETVSMSYKKITWDYAQPSQTQPGGNKGKSTATWSLEENKGK